jgi:hypothetical protein
MNIHDATECSYKNGYMTGVKEFAERLKEQGTPVTGEKDLMVYM